MSPAGITLVLDTIKSVATGLTVETAANSIRCNAGANIDGVVVGVVAMICAAVTSVIAGGAKGVTITTGVGGRRRQHRNAPRR